MKITYKNYWLEYDQNRFNLYARKPSRAVNKAQADKHNVNVGDVVGEHNELIGYGYKLETALESLLKDITCSAKETLELRSFLSQYRKEKEELVHIVQNQLNVPVIK